MVLGLHLLLQLLVVTHAYGSSGNARNGAFVIHTATLSNRPTQYRSMLREQAQMSFGAHGREVKELAGSGYKVALQVDATSDIAILLAFNAGVVADPANVLADWQESKEGAPCSWFGVNCTSLSHVSSLNLTNQQLQGVIHPGLGSLPFLSVLDLSRNVFSGSIPSELGQGAELKVLDLSENWLSGQIPHQLGALRKLQVLWLRFNDLSGVIPPELGRCSKLEYLGIGAASRSSNEDEPSSSLINGTIPEQLSTLTSLQVLDLGNNQLFGGIPSWIGSLVALQALVLQDNNFVGSIPKELGNCTRLASLWLSHNGLSGPIPSELGQLQQLQELGLYFNFLNGSLPGSIGNCSSLRFLGVGGNTITGKIPPSIGNLTSLYHFDVGRNRMTGGTLLTLCRYRKEQSIPVEEMLHRVAASQQGGGEYYFHQWLEVAHKEAGQPPVLRACIEYATLLDGHIILGQEHEIEKAKVRVIQEVTEDCYPDSNVKQGKERGSAVLISMEKYKSGYRLGGEVDRGRLESLAESFHLRLYGNICLNFPADDLRETMIDTAQTGIAAEDECFVCFVNAHGGTADDGAHYFEDTEGAKVFLLDDIVDPFRKCQNLFGKPKLFFVNSCRGPLKLGSANGLGVEQRVPLQWSEGKEVRYAQQYSDCLIVFATSEHAVSIRDNEYGTNFVFALMQAFDNKRMSLAGMSLA